MNKHLFVIICALLFSLIPFSDAFGVSPGRTTLDFKPDFSQEVFVALVNSAQEDFTVSIFAEGDLAPYITIPDDYVFVSSLEKEKTFYYFITLPNILPPGVSSGKIIAKEIPRDDTIGVQSNLGVVSEVYIHNLHGGIYAQADLYVSNNDEGGVLITIPIVNQGTEAIEDAYGVASLYSQNGSLIEEIRIPPKTILSGEKEDLQFMWDASPGEYTVISSIYYGEEIILLEKQFSIGSRRLEVSDFILEDFLLGEISRIKIVLENNWNGQTSDVFLTATIHDSKGEQVSSLTSPTKNLPSRGTEEFEIFWDTKGLSAGIYSVDLAIYSASGGFSDSFEIETTEDSLNIFWLGKVISSRIDSRMPVLLLGTLLFGLLLLIALVLILIRREHYLLHPRTALKR